MSLEGSVVRLCRTEDASLWASVGVHSRCHTGEESVDGLVDRQFALVSQPVHQVFVEYLLHAKFGQYSGERGKCRHGVCRIYAVEGSVSETCWR